MGMRTLARKTAIGFAAGVIAGVMLSQTVKKRALPRPEPVRPQAQAALTPAPAKPDGIQGLTKQQLYQEAKRRNIRGRSTMTKAELRRALR